MHMCVCVCVCVCVYAVMQWDFIYTVGKGKKFPSIHLKFIGLALVN